MSDQQETKEGPDAKVESGREQSVSFWERTTRVMSIMALLISVLTAYFNVIRKTDELSVVVSAYPTVYIDHESGNLGLGHLEQRFTFINSGSDSMAVTEEGVSIGVEPQCDPVIGLSYDIAPVVIKSGEIVSQELKRTRKNWAWEHGKPTISNDTEILDPTILKPKIDNVIYVCAYFTVVSSANVTLRKMVPLYKGRLMIMTESTLIGDILKNRELFFKIDQPIILLHRYGTIFNQ